VLKYYIPLLCGQQISHEPESPLKLPIPRILQEVHYAELCLIDRHLSHYQNVKEYINLLLPHIAIPILFHLNLFISSVFQVQPVHLSRFSAFEEA